MTAPEQRLDPLGPHVRAVIWRDADRRRVAEVTYRSTGGPVARVYGARTHLDERVRRAVLRRAGRRPASVQWYDLRTVDGVLAPGRHEDEPTVEVPAVWDVAQPTRESVVAHLLAMAERVEAEGVDGCRVERRQHLNPNGSGERIEVRLTWDA